MKRTITSAVGLAVLVSGCGSDGAAEGFFEAIGLSENVDVTAPELPPGSTDPVADLLGRLDDAGFNGIVLIDEAGSVRSEPFGTADGPDGPPIDEDTVFDIGSITKQFTGAAIVRLEMDGVLSVDDAVGDHLDELDGRLAGVTLHELLTHTAGLPDAIGADDEPIDRAAFLERAVSQVGAPGEFRYSNVGYSLLGMVIETVTDGSYEEYLQDVLFEPAGMESTGYVLPDFDERTVAVGYDGDVRLMAPDDVAWADDGPWWNLRANGGILSTAADMRRWNRALDGDEVLSAQAKEKLFARHVEEGEGSGTYYGYGWVSFPRSDGSWFHGHNGGNGIFFADLLRFPDEDAMIFLASNTAGADEDAAFRIGEALLDRGAGAACLPTSDPTSFPVVDDFPPTDAGASAAALVEVLLGGDRDDRRAFAERHVSEQLAQGASIDELVEEIGRLQAEFAGDTVDAIHQEDDHRLHVVLSSPERSAVVTVSVDQADPVLISCVEIGV
ncbi:MAG: serine hydrolase domain-containing protein [Actinomycetota bacterium]